MLKHSLPLIPPCSPPRREGEIRAAHLICCLLFIATCLGGCRADTAPDHTERNAVIEAAGFKVYNDRDTNLHDFLYWHGARNPPPDTSNACLTGLATSVKGDWDAAVDWYVSNVSHRHHRTDPLIRTIRYRNAGLDATPPPADPDTLQRTLDVLEAAAPVYSECWWDDHRARNQAWIDRLESLLEVYGDSLERRITESLGLPLSGAVPVDIVGYASWSGANTITDPDHILMSSVNQGYQDYHSLEMVFHEVSHTLIGGNQGPVVAALTDAALQQTGEELQIPRTVWHSILFYTAGFHTADLLAANGIDNYDMYMMDGRGVYSQMHPHLERIWRPYLEGAVELDVAADRMVRALIEDDES